MGRHRTAEEKARTGMAGRTRAQLDDLRQVATELRRSGRTYDDIALELGISKSTCSLWLRDVTPERRAPVRGGRDVTGQLALELAPASGRELARARRREGALLREIAAEQGVSTSTAWSWCAGLPVPPRARHGGDAEHVRRMSRSRWDRVLAERERERQEVHQLAAASVGPLSPRDLVLALAVSYWCEGTKSKPWRRREGLTWMNSDPGLVRLFLAGLRELDVPPERLRFRLSIHESADEAVARAWWADVVGVAPETFLRSTLKRHRPGTVRLNTGAHYRGCLVVRVLQSRALYQQVDGLVQGLVAAAAAAPASRMAPSSPTTAPPPSAVG